MPACELTKKISNILVLYQILLIFAQKYIEMKIKEIQYISPDLFAPKDAWDKLSMAEKSEMMKVAVRNGITNLQEIRKKYNEFAEGGDKKTPRPVTTGGAGYIPPVVSGPNAAQAGTLKDIAYRIMSQSSAENRGLGHIAKGVLESIAGQPYDQMYTGSFSGGNDDMEPDTTRDLNHLIVYGNTKGQYQPKELRGFDYSNYLQKNYGVNTMPTYEGRIVMANKINIPTEYSPLVEWLSDRPKYGYYVDPDKDADVIQDWDNLPFLTVDDTASYRRSFRRDKNGKPELANQDLIDYGGKDYGRKYGTLAGLQGAVLNRVINSPVILDQGLPVNFTNNPEDFEQGEGWYNTLKSIVDRNHILQDNGNGNYSYPLVLPDINVFGRKRAEGGKIHIKPSHRGRLTELKRRTGKTEAELYRTGSPATRKMITFARNARKWKHGDGGNLFDGESEPTQQMVIVPDNTYVAKPSMFSSIAKKDYDWEEAALNRTNQVYSNYDEAKDEPLSWANTKLRNTLRWLQDRDLNPLGSGVSNCTLSATQWVDPNMPIKGAASIHKNPEKYNYSSIDSLDIVPGNLIISKVPNKDSYHTMMVTGFAGQDSTATFRGKNYPVKKGEPLMTYSRGGHDNSFIQRNIPLSVYTANSDGHTENLFYRYNYPREVFLPEITVISKKKKK